MEQHTQALIVGGGPTGLSAALLLARYGIESVLIERRPGVSIHPRARGLNIRTMEIYRGLGLERVISQAGQALAGNRWMLFVETLAGHEVRRVADDELMTVRDKLARITPCNWCQCAQDELEPLLVQAIENESPRVDLRFSTELVTLTQDTTGVSATVRDQRDGKEYTIYADYLIAADGAKSSVRQLLNIAMEGRASMGRFNNVYFRADLQELVRERQFGICFIENSDVEGVLLPVNNTDRWLLNIEAGETDTSQLSNEEYIALVRKAIGLPELEVEILSVLPWVANARVAARMQDGKVFLAGDAAHTMPPAGGFGLNTGVQDVHNLAWKLAAVLSGHASAALLETYQQERYPIAQKVVEEAARELEAASPDRRGSEGNPLIPIIGYRYGSNAIIDDGSQDEQDNKELHLDGQTGTRAPHVWLEHNGTHISTLDLFGRSFVLLTGTQDDSWLKTGQAIAARYHAPLTIYRIGQELQDTEHRWHEAYGVTEQGTVLIRPDGFVAWRLKEPITDQVETLKKVMGKILGKG